MRPVVPLLLGDRHMNVSLRLLSDSVVEAGN